VRVTVQVFEELKGLGSLDHISQRELADLQAFVDIDILLTGVTPKVTAILKQIDSARQQAVIHIKPFHSQVKVKYFLMGSEVLH